MRAVSRLPLIVTCVLLLVASGCETEPASPPAPTGKVVAGPGGPWQGGSSPSDGAPAAGPGAAAAAFPIRLSAGTALPQTGPEGTLMGFSVDFQSAGYQPQPGTRCILVIERADRQRAEQPAEISASGTWALLVQGWPPEAGPFQAWVEEVSEAGSRRALSATVPLQ